MTELSNLEKYSSIGFILEINDTKIQIYSEYVLDLLLGTYNRRYTSSEIDTAIVPLKSSGQYFRKAESFTPEQIVIYIEEEIFGSEKYKKCFKQILPALTSLSLAYIIALFYIARYLRMTSSKTAAVEFIFKFLEYDYKSGTFIPNIYFNKKAFVLKYIDEIQKKEVSFSSWYFINNRIQETSDDGYDKNDILTHTVNDVLIPDENIVSNTTFGALSMLRRTDFYKTFTLAYLSNIFSDIDNIKSTIHETNNIQNWNNIESAIIDNKYQNIISNSKNVTNYDDRYSTSGIVDMNVLRKKVYNHISKVSYVSPVIRTPIKYDIINYSFDDDKKSSVIYKTKGIPSVYLLDYINTLSKNNIPDSLNDVISVIRGDYNNLELYFDKSYAKSLSTNSSDKPFLLLDNKAGRPYLNKLISNSLNQAVLVIAEYYTAAGLNTMDLLTHSQLLPRNDGLRSLNFESLYSAILRKNLAYYINNEYYTPTKETSYFPKPGETISFDINDLKLAADDLNKALLAYQEDPSDDNKKDLNEKYAEFEKQARLYLGFMTTYDKNVFNKKSIFEEVSNFLSTSDKEYLNSLNTMLDSLDKISDEDSTIVSFSNKAKDLLKAVILTISRKDINKKYSLKFTEYKSYIEDYVSPDIEDIKNNTDIINIDFMKMIYSNTTGNKKLLNDSINDYTTALSDELFSDIKYDKTWSAKNYNNYSLFAKLSEMLGDYTQINNFNNIFTYTTNNNNAEYIDNISNDIIISNTVDNDIKKSLTEKSAVSLKSSKAYTISSDIADLLSIEIDVSPKDENGSFHILFSPDIKDNIIRPIFLDFINKTIENSKNDNEYKWEDYITDNISSNNNDKTENVDTSSDNSDKTETIIQFDKIFSEVADKKYEPIKKYIKALLGKIFTAYRVNTGTFDDSKLDITFSLKKDAAGSSDINIFNDIYMFKFARNVICGYRNIFLDMIHRDSFNVMINSFITTVNNSGSKYSSTDKLYTLDYSSFNKDNDNRKNALNICKSYLSKSMSDSYMMNLDNDSDNDKNPIYKFIWSGQ